MGAFGKRHKGWTLDSILSTTAFTPGHAPACSSPCLLLLLLVDMCMLPTGVHRVGWEGAFWLHCASWWLPPPPLACLLLVVTKFGCTAGEGIFASGLLNSSFAQIRSAVRRKKLIKGVAVCLAATVLAVGWKAPRHFYTPTLWLCHVAFPEGSSLACLPVGMCWG